MKYFCTLLFSILLFLLAPDAAMAAPASPALANTTLPIGKTGEVRMSTNTTAANYNKLMFCNGTSWLEFPGSPTAVVCAKNGEIYQSGGELYYCNNLFAWAFDSSGGTNGACAKSGEIKYNAGTIEFCNGTDWRTVNTADATADAFSFTNNSSYDVDKFSDSIVRVTGFSGGIGTFTFNAAACVSPSIRVCADSGCTTTISSRTTTGTLTVPNGSYLRAMATTGPAASTTCTIQADVGGQSSTYNVTTTASDTTVLYQSGQFVAAVGQASSSTILSNIVKVSGHTGVTVSVGDAGYGGSPEFQVCNDSTCTSVAVSWGTAPQALTNPQWLQLRTTTGAGLNYRMVELAAGSSPNIYWNVSTGTCPMSTTLTSGASITCTCPVGIPLTGVNVGGLTGVNNYRQSSGVPYLCRAAVHAGAISNATGGSITAVGLTAGTPPGTCPNFNGSTANGTTSSAGGTAGTSFYFPGFGSDVCN